jgi:hypothetical protein
LTVMTVSSVRFRVDGADVGLADPALSMEAPRQQAD